MAAFGPMPTRGVPPLHALHRLRGGLSWEREGSDERGARLTPGQRAVLALIESTPGIPLRNLADALAVRERSVAYHIGRLEAIGRVHSVRAGRRRLVFPSAAGFDDADVAALDALRHPHASALAAAIVATPHTSARQLRSRVAFSRRAFYHHLKRMRATGLVTKDGRGLLPAEKLPRLLARLRAEGEVGAALRPPGPPARVRFDARRPIAVAP